MAGALKKLTSELYETWLEPAEALRQLSHLGSTAQAAWVVLPRLQRGLIRAGARTVFAGSGSSQSQVDMTRIEPGIWELVSDHFGHDKFWQSGDCTVEQYGRRGETVQIALFGVRFDPSGIIEMLPKAATPPAALVPETSTTQEKGPPVPEAALKAWYSAYQLAYKGAEDTEEMAIRSAKGAFPGKSASRERVRELRGERPRGRKSTLRE